MTSEPVRYRLTGLQMAITMSPALLWVLSAVLLGRADDPGLPSASFVVVLAVLTVAVVASTLWFGVTLTPTEAIVHNLRRRRVAWSSVVEVCDEEMLGTRTVVLVEAHRRTRLRAPVSHLSTGGRSFEVKLGEIRQWWQEHRGPEWKEPASPATWWSTRG